MQIPGEGREGAAAVAAETQSLEKASHTPFKVRGEPRVSRRRKPERPLRVRFPALTAPCPSSHLLLFLLSDGNPGLSRLPRGSAQPLWSLSPLSTQPAASLRSGHPILPLQEPGCGQGPKEDTRSAGLGDKSPGMFPLAPRKGGRKYEVIDAQASLLEGMASKEVVSGVVWPAGSHGGHGAFTAPPPLLSLNQSLEQKY